MAWSSTGRPRYPASEAWDKSARRPWKFPFVQVKSASCLPTILGAGQNPVKPARHRPLFLQRTRERRVRAWNRCLTPTRFCPPSQHNASQSCWRRMKSHRALYYVSLSIDKEVWCASRTRPTAKRRRRTTMCPERKPRTGPTGDGQHSPGGTPGDSESGSCGESDQMGGAIACQIGSSMCTRVPFPRALSIHTFPWCASSTCFTKARPIPVDSSFSLSPS